MLWWFASGGRAGNSQRPSGNRKTVTLLLDFCYFCLFFLRLFLLFSANFLLIFSVEQRGWRIRNRKAPIEIAGAELERAVAGEG